MERKKELLRQVKELEEETHGKAFTTTNLIKAGLLAKELFEKGVNAEDIKLIDGSYVEQ